MSEPEVRVIALLSVCFRALVYRMAMTFMSPCSLLPGCNECMYASSSYHVTMSLSSSSEHAFFVFHLHETILARPLLNPYLGIQSR